MSNLFWLSGLQFALVRRCFPLAFEASCSNCCKVLTRITCLICNGLRWRDVQTLLVGAKMQDTCSQKRAMAPNFCENTCGSW